MIRSSEGVAVLNKFQQIKRDHGVFGEEQHGGAFRDLGFCSSSKRTAAAAGGRAAAWQVAEVQRQCHELYSEMDITLPLYWESKARICRSSLDVLEFEFNRAHTAAQQAESQASQHRTHADDDHAHELQSHKGQTLQLSPLHLFPRLNLELPETFSNEKKLRRNHQVLLQQAAGDSSLVIRNVEAQELTDHIPTSCNVDFSPASGRSLRMSYSNLTGMKSHELHAGHAPAAVNTKLFQQQESRSSSFQSQSSSGGAWEVTSGSHCKDSGADMSCCCSSRDSTASLGQESSMSCCNGKHDQYYGRVSTTEDNDFKAHQSGASFPKDCSNREAQDFYSCGKQAAAAETRTSALYSTLLRPWKFLFGGNAKKFSTRLRSKEAEHIDDINRFSRLLDALDEAPIISFSAPLQKTSYALVSPVKTHKLREKNTHRSTIPFFAKQAPPFTVAIPNTSAAADEQQTTSASSEKSDPTLRVLRRESSLRCIHVQNSPSGLLPGISSNKPSSNAQASQKLPPVEPRLTHSQSATLVATSTSAANPHGGGGGGSKPLLSTERWKKYVKMLNPLYPRRFSHTHEVPQTPRKSRLENTRTPPITSLLSTTAPAAATTVAQTPANTSQIGTATVPRQSRIAIPSRKTNHHGSGGVLGTHFPGSASSKVQASSEWTSTTKVATAAPSSKISRKIIAASSGVKTPNKSKSSVNTNYQASFTRLDAVREPGVTKHSTISEQHNAVQGAIAHCKQSHSGQLLRSIS
ncbi:hypothetical protein CY35_15G009600 [Sphagnum magellanicum]|nr:hypothetical protein CY35_15G009600 [Sphagnum magellanicum]